MPTSGERSSRAASARRTGHRRGRRRARAAGSHHLALPLVGLDEPSILPSSYCVCEPDHSWFVSRKQLCGARVQGRTGRERADLRGVQALSAPTRRRCGRVLPEATEVVVEGAFLHQDDDRLDGDVLAVGTPRPSVSSASHRARTCTRRAGGPVASSGRVIARSIRGVGGRDPARRERGRPPCRSSTRSFGEEAAPSTEAAAMSCLRMRIDLSSRGRAWRRRTCAARGSTRTQRDDRWSSGCCTRSYRA